MRVGRICSGGREEKNIPGVKFSAVAHPCVVAACRPPLPPLGWSSFFLSFFRAPGGGRGARGGDAYTQSQMQIHSFSRRLIQQ